MSGIKDIIVDSFKEVDIEGLIVPNIVMYKGPDDYKDKYVARIFALTKPTNTIIIRETAEELEKNYYKDDPELRKVLEPYFKK